MQRTPLYSYLEKVAAGDASYRSKLCQQLADRLIYVPILERQSSRAAVPGQLKVQVVTLVDGDRDQVLLFTTEKLYKSWAVTFPQRTSFISLLGGDFCAALRRGTSVAVDVGTGYSVVLDEDAVREVASSGPEEQSAPAAPPAARPVNDLRGRSEPTSFMQRPKMMPSGAAALPTPQEDSDDSEETLPPSTSPLFAGAFAAGAEPKSSAAKSRPAYDEDYSDEPNPGIQFSAGQRPVIFSPDSDSNRVVRDREDPDKKRRKSFLKFLKGS